jgi:hypothetical protein
MNIFIILAFAIPAALLLTSAVVGLTDAILDHFGGKDV